MKTKQQVISIMQEILADIQSNIKNIQIAVPDYKTYFLVARGENIIVLWYEEWGLGTHNISSPHFPSRSHGSNTVVRSNPERPSIKEIEELLSTTIYKDPQIRKYKSLDNYVSENSHTTYEIINL